MKVKVSILAHVVILLALLPTAVSANMGSPLMLASTLHLLFGNGVIGYIEALIITKVFRTSLVTTGNLMMLANYFSAFLGYLVITSSLIPKADITIENLQVWFWALVISAYVLTLLIEFPFVFGSMYRKLPHPFKSAILASLLVQSVTTIFLVGYYGIFISGSPMTTYKVVPPAQIVVAPEYTLYYLTPDGSKVMQSGLKGERAEVVLDVNPPASEGTMFGHTTPEGRHDLYLHNMADFTPSKIQPIDTAAKHIREGFSAKAPVLPEDGKQTWDLPRSMNTVWRVPSFDGSSDWKFRVDFWPGLGLSGKKREEDDTYTSHEFAISLPFVTWGVHNVVEVEEGIVVIQLGEDQICLVDVATRRVALITRGRGPVVALQPDTIPSP